MSGTGIARDLFAEGEIVEGISNGLGHGCEKARGAEVIDVNELRAGRANGVPGSQIVVTAMTWSGSVAWRIPRKKPRAMMEKKVTIYSQTAASALLKIAGY